MPRNPAATPTHDTTTPPTDPNGPALAHLEVLRGEIADRKNQLTAADESPITLKEALDNFNRRLDAEVATSSQIFKRSVTAWCTPHLVRYASQFDATDVRHLPFLFAERMREESTRVITAAYENTDQQGIPLAERRERMAAIEKEIYDLEIVEEELICQIEENGRPVARRPDVRPEVVIGIEPDAVVPWDWTSKKVDRLYDQHDAHEVAWRAARGRYLNYRNKLSDLRIRRQEARYSSPEAEAIVDQEIAYTERSMENQRAIMEERVNIYQSSIGVTEAVRTYIDTHRAPKPSAYVHGQESIVNGPEVPFTRDSPFPEWAHNFQNREG